MEWRPVISLYQTYMFYTADRRLDSDRDRSRNPGMIRDLIDVNSGPGKAFCEDADIDVEKDVYI